MSNESPFFLTKIECPICKTVNEFETVRVGSYYENGRDTDFCPKEIKWRYPRYQGYNPLVYFTAMCTNCYYTREFNNSFKEWKGDNNFRMYRLKTIKEKHLERLAEAESIIRSIGEAIDIARHPNESAILKLVLAIYDERLAERCSNLDLGRFYLRIGWVFRELEKGENPGVTFLKGMMLEVDRQFGSLKDSLEKNREELDTFSRHLFSHFETDQLSGEVRSRMLPYRDKFTPDLDGLKKNLSDNEARIKALAELMDEYKSVAFGNEGAGEGMSFGSHRSFTDFLLTLTRRWDGIVTNERESLQQAIAHYKKAFASGRDISPGNQQIQASYLIAELSRRIESYDDARQYFNSTIKHGQEYIYQNRQDPSRTALARKILELAIEQGKANMQALKSSQEG